MSIKLLRHKEPIPNSVINIQKYKQQEKYMMRVLEDCKQISKSDRLQIRSFIKMQNEDILKIFRDHRKRPNHQTLQIHLRKYVNKIKIQKQTQIIRGFKQAFTQKQGTASKQLKVKTQQTQRNNENKITRLNTETKNQNLKRPKWINQYINSCCNSKQKYGKKMIKSYENSPNLSINEGYGKSSRYQMNCKISKKNTEIDEEKQNQELFHSSNHSKYDTKYRQVFTTRKLDTENFNYGYNSPYSSNQQFDNKLPLDKYNSVFTDPKMLQQCRDIIKKHSSISFCSSNNGKYQNGYNSLIQPFIIFSSKNAEDVMNFFFLPSQVKINRQVFKYRMQQFMKINYLSSLYYQKIDNYFDLLSENNVNLDIVKFGKTIDEYCVPQMNQIRNLFKSLDKFKTGYLQRNSIKNEKWYALFDKANFQNKESIGYWELYTVRKGWEYYNFSQGFNPHQK